MINDKVVIEILIHFFVLPVHQGLFCCVNRRFNQPLLPCILIALPLGVSRYLSYVLQSASAVCCSQVQVVLSDLLKL